MEWLETKDLGRVDSSVCNETERDHFLGLIGNENIKFNGFTNDCASKNYLDWIELRNFQISTLTLKRSYSNAEIEKFVPLVSNMKILIVHEDSQKFRVGFRFLIKQCPLLEEIHLSQCGVITDLTLRALVDHCPLLKKLFMPCLVSDTCVISHDDFHHFVTNAENLETLTLRNFNGMTKMFETVFENCTKLTEFTICMGNNNHGVSLDSIKIHPQMGTHLLVLRVLQFSFRVGFFTRMCSACPQLTLLDISGSKLLVRSIHTTTDVFLNCIMEHNVHLTELNISNFPGCQISTKFVHELLERCLKLRKLYMYSQLQGIMHTDGYPLHQVISQATQLQTLGVCTQKIGKVSVEALRKIDTLEVVSSPNAVWSFRY
jgi:hypothetical protein